MSKNNEYSPLEEFLREPVNTVTKERIFYNRLYSDLKLAAARHQYPLSLFEPEVDRDKFDIVLDDGDSERRIQLKTVLKSAFTASWETTKRFLRPEMAFGEKLGISPADCGLGGGFILIEIDAADDQAPVTYYYTDYFITQAFDMRMLAEAKPDGQTARKRGRPPHSRKQFAEEFLATLHSGDPSDEVRVPFQLFVRAKSADALLALAGLHNGTGSSPVNNSIFQSVIFRFQADEHGRARDDLDAKHVATAQYWSEEILALLDEPNLQAFDRHRQTKGS